MILPLEIPSGWWEPRAVDAAVVLVAVVLLGFGLLWLGAGIFMRLLRWLTFAPRIIFKSHRPISHKTRIRLTRKIRTAAWGVGGVAGALLTTFVAYATFRTSNMLTALQYLSDQSNNIADMETTTAEAICIYRWGEQHRWGEAPEETLRHGCGSEIFVHEGRLSKSFDDIQLYVEESLLYFIQARIYRERYDADYYEGLRYWGSDFADDWTGAVSFYVITREIEFAEAQDAPFSMVSAASIACLERYAQIPPIEDICGKYYGFLRALGTAGAGLHSNVRCEGVRDDRAELLNDLPRDFCDHTWWGVNFVGRSQ
jgi:hypothetical protein